MQTGPEGVRELALPREMLYTDSRNRVGNGA